MAVRSAQLADLAYVPNYNTLNTDLVNTVDSAIQQQSAKNQQFAMDTLGELQEGVTSSLSNLNAEDQLYAQNVVNETRDKIDERFTTQGTRGSLSFIQREAQNFQNKLQPHFKFSETQKQIKEQLSESDAPSVIKNSIDPGKIDYDEQGKADYSGLEQKHQRRLQVAADWQDISEYMQDFNSKARKANSEETVQQGQVQTASGEVSDTTITRIVERLDGGDLMQNNINALLSNPKMREQLAVLAEIELEQEPENISVDQHGRINETLYLPRKNKEGEYVDKNNNVVSDPLEADVKSESVTYNNKEQWQASRFARPYAERDAYYKTKYETKQLTRGKENTSDDLSESSIYRNTIGVNIPETSASDFFSNANKQVEQLERTNERALNGVYQELENYFSPDADTDLAVHFEEGELRVKVGTENYTTEELEQEFATKMQNAGNAERYRLRNTYSSIANKFAILEVNEAEANALQRTIEHANTAVINNLRESKFGDISNIISFGENGTISINEKELRNSDIAEKDFGSNIPLSVSIDEDTDDLQIGEIREVNSKQTISTGANTQRVETDPILVYKNKDGKIKHVSDSSGKVGELISHARKLQQNHINSITGGGTTEEFNGVRLSYADDKHKDLIEGFKEHKLDPSSDGGAFVNTEGTPITTNEFNATNGHKFAPNTVVMVDGEPTVVGQVFNEDNNPIEELKNIRYTGTYAEDLAQDLYGPNYEDVINAETFKSFFPKLIGDKETVSLSNNAINRMLRTNFSNDFEIKYKNVSGTNGNYDEFRVYEDGQQVFVANDAYDMVFQFLNYSKASNETN